MSSCPATGSSNGSLQRWVKTLGFNPQLVSKGWGDTFLASLNTTCTVPVSITREYNCIYNYFEVCRRKYRVKTNFGICLLNVFLHIKTLALFVDSYSTDYISCTYKRCMYSMILPWNVPSLSNNADHNIPCVCDILITAILVQNMLLT